MIAAQVPPAAVLVPGGMIAMYVVVILLGRKLDGRNKQK